MPAVPVVHKGRRSAKQGGRNVMQIGSNSSSTTAQFNVLEQSMVKIQRNQHRVTSELSRRVGRVNKESHL